MSVESPDKDKIESWLDRVELFLMELHATDRAQLILDLNQQIQAQLMVNHELKVDDVLKKMGDPMQVANRVRSERGFKPRRRQPTSKSKPILLFVFLGVFLFLATCTVSLPFLVPWGLGHLVSSLNQDPTSTGVHSFQFFKNFGGMGSGEDADKHDPNDLNAGGSDQNDDENSSESAGDSSTPRDTAPDSTPDSAANPPGAQTSNPPIPSTDAQENINGSFQADGMKAVHIEAKDIKLKLTSTSASGIDYACKISSLGYARPFIRQSPSGVVTLAISQVAESASCEIKIPENLSLEVLADSGQIELKDLAQNVNVDAVKADISFSPRDKTAFDIEANTKKGEVKGLSEFQKKQAPLKLDKKFKAKLSLEEGNINLAN